MKLFFFFIKNTTGEILYCSYIKGVT